MFFTTEQLNRLIRNGDLPRRGGNHVPVAKLVLPGTGCAWLITEQRGAGDQARVYGLADFGTGYVRLGTIALQRLKGLTDPIGNHPVQRHQAFIARYPLAVYARAASIAGCITEDDDSLAVAAQYCTAFERERAVQDEPFSQTDNWRDPLWPQSASHPLPF